MGEVREAARLARECGVVAQALTLARWIGENPRQVTAGEVLRRADVPVAGAALGIRVPAKVRTAADVPALHVPWCTGVATGPPIWRRVLLPAGATLGDLHRVIQILYGWDGDHLHDFAVGDQRYSDPLFELEEMADEEEVRVPKAFGLYTR